MAYGLTLEGFNAKTLPIIRAGIEAILRESFGGGIDLSDESVEGKVSGIVSEVAALIWELGEGLYASFDVDKALGQALEALCALTGTFRPQATYSAVTLTLTGTPTTEIPEGSFSESESTGRQWLHREDAELVALDAWAPTTAYTATSPASRVTNGGNAYVCITSGVSAGSGGPTTEDADITDGTAHWRFMGAGTAADDIEARATETGPIVAVSGDITVTATPIGGWDGVINLLDASEGRNLGTDEELRILRELELAQPGNATINALRAAILEVTGVQSATVFTNPESVEDEDGMPPHSVEVMVLGGEDQDIWDALLDNVAAGIATHGTEVGTSTDDEDTEHEVKFSRPEEIEIYISITLVKDPDEYPLDGDDQIKAAIVEWGDAQKAGKDAVASAILARVFDIDGVLSANMPLIGTAPGPVASTTIAINKRQLATYDTSRISITTSDGTP